MSDKTRGLYRKFVVRRTDGSSRRHRRHHECEYFVLDLTHDPLAYPALAAYEEHARADGYRLLADDLLRQLARMRDELMLTGRTWSEPILSISQKQRINKLLRGPETSDA